MNYRVCICDTCEKFFIPSDSLEERFKAFRKDGYNYCDIHLIMYAKENAENGRRQRAEDIASGKMLPNLSEL